MDIRLDGPFVEALLRLQKINGLKYPVAMVRELIREAAKEAGVWPTLEELESLPESDEPTNDQA
jgi:hypothetical protein